MKKILIAIFTLFIFSSAHSALVKDDFIANVGVNSSTPDYGSSWGEVSITNNSGMNDAADPGNPLASHDYNNLDQWVTTEGHPTGTLNFGLGNTFNLSHIAWWNGHQGHASARGANLINIQTSTNNGSSFLDLGNWNIAQSALGSSGPETVIDLSAILPTADFVRINILSNHGDTDFLTVREIRFYEGEAANVPEPLSISLIAIGALGLLFRRKYNK